MAAKAKDNAKELQNYVEELKTDAIEKDTHLDHLQERNDELSTLLEKAKGDAVAKFKASKPFTDLLDTNYEMGFEDFKMEAIENFPKVDFSSIKLNLCGATSSSLLQTSLEDINIEDNATTQPAQNNPSVDAPPSRRRHIMFILVFFLFFFHLVHCFGLFKVYLSTFNSSTVLGRAV